MAQVSGGIGEAVAAVLVLVIDDDPQVRYLIRLALEEEGFDVATAGDGAHALQLAAERSPWLVVLDVSLPDMASVTVADQLRAACPAVPVLVITADGRAAEKAARLGAYAYLHKPFDVGDLVALVRRGLQADR
jgi:DNA-binding response OmpR family regulator